MLNTIAKFLLNFSHEIIIIPLVIFGYIWLNKKVFFNAICLILISMLLNFALKITFQVPLATAIGKEGFAFPSGHMQSSATLYGWLIIKYNNLTRILLTMLLIGIGFSLVYSGFHNYFDILGAILFASLLICLYIIITTKKEKWTTSFLLLFSTFLMLYINSIYNITDHIWMTYYGLIGLILSEKIFEKYVVEINTSKTKILATLICTIILFIIKITITNINTLNLPIFVNYDPLKQVA